MNWDGVPARFKGFHKFTVAGIAIFIVLIIVLVLALSSTVNIAGDEVGIVQKKLLGRKLPSGRIIAVNGENGIQADMLMPGWHFWKFPWMYKIDKKMGSRCRWIWFMRRNGKIRIRWQTLNIS